MKDIIAVSPVAEIPIESAAPFDCEASGVRDPRQSKGQNDREARLSNGSSYCEKESCC